MKHAFTPKEQVLSSLEQVMAHLCQEVPTERQPLLQQAIESAWLSYHKQPERVSSVRVAFALKGLGVDLETLTAALLSSPLLESELSLEQLGKLYGKRVAALVKSVRWLNSLPEYDGAERHGPEQAERLRSMVLAMVDDVRAVLIKLAYRAQRLHLLTHESVERRRAIAQETLDIYAPLANRLGIGQLKWEMEDLCFRYLEPMAYKQIAKALEERREDREYFIHSFMILLQDELAKEEIHNADISGRPKHIYSIWRKMQKKNVEFSDLFDVRAVRVMVDKVSECYTVLGVVHALWPHISKEFDDYIANPKPNGYKSLHTAVVGPQGKAVEVQIRTREMHEHAEHGVAAHWRYKEGGKEDRQLHDSINALRQLLESDQSSESLLESFSGELFADRVFVFTPSGQVLDLPQGATPLDFAFQIHTDVGNRCRGAKINGHIVPLTYTLKNGDQVEVLTTKEPKPSRDWLNKSLGYLQTSRARNKVRSWFNIQDQDQHLEDGRQILERELKRLNVHDVSIEGIARRLGYEKLNDLLIALGRNVIGVAQLVDGIEALSHPLVREEPIRISMPSAGDSVSGGVSVLGVGNLLTRISSCCKPAPNDEIVGYITRGKGVTIHRQDCSNMQNLNGEERRRLVEVSWGDARDHCYSVDVRIIAYDRTGLLKDITSVLSNENVNVTALNTRSDFKDQTATFHVTLEVADVRQLSGVLSKIEQLPNILDVQREG